MKLREGPSDRRDANARPLRNLAPREALPSQLGDAIAADNDSRAADRPSASGSLRHGAIETGANSFPDSDSLLLGNHGEHGNHGVPKHSARIEIRFGQRSEPHSCMVQTLEVHVGLGNALSAESVERPKHEHVDLSLRGVRHQRAKLCTIGFSTGLVVLVLEDDGPVLSQAEFAELVALVRGLLAFVVGRYTGVQGGSHRKPPSNQWVSGDRGKYTGWADGGKSSICVQTGEPITL
jgi:hypothetical protein